MRINFLVNEVAGGWEPTDTRLGGTEESVVAWADQLTNRGHYVNVFYNGHEGWNMRSSYEAAYWPREDYHGGGDICINIKSSGVDPKEPTLYLTNETNASDLDLSKYLGVIWPSQWVEENIPVNNPRRFILPHGYNPKQVYPIEKIPKQCLYASSPDRGLQTLLRAWLSVLTTHPDATLIVTYGAQEYDMPGVTFMDATEEQMNELYRTSDVWAYPCNGGELYCMTGIKAQAAGCVPVIIPTMALKETVRASFIADESNYADTLIKALSSPQERDVMRKFLVQQKYPTWADSTDRLLEIINDVIPLPFPTLHHSQNRGQA